MVLIECFTEQEHKHPTAGIRRDGHPPLEVSITPPDRKAMKFTHKSMNTVITISPSSSFPSASLHQTTQCCTYLQFHILLNMLKSSSWTPLSNADGTIIQIKPSRLTIKWTDGRPHFWGVTEVENLGLQFSAFKYLFLLCNSLFCDCSQRLQLKLSSWGTRCCFHEQLSMTLAWKSLLCKSGFSKVLK